MLHHNFMIEKITSLQLLTIYHMRSNEIMQFNTFHRKSMEGISSKRVVYIIIYSDFEFHILKFEKDYAEVISNVFKYS